MKKITFLVAALCTAMFANAESFTITFNSNNAGDGSTAVSTTEDIVATGTEHVSAVTANNIYLGKSGYGIKGGSSSKKGVLTLTLDQEYAITSIVANVAAFDINKTISINGQTITFANDDSAKELHDETITLDGTKTNEITIAAGVTSKNRWYCTSITVNYTTTTTAIENVEASDIYAANGRIEGIGAGRIYTVSGMDVTEQNGQLRGIYVVKVDGKAHKIAVK